MVSGGSVLAACQAAASAAPSGAQATATSAATSAVGTLARARSDGVIRVGFANEAPFAYADPNGKVTGFVTDIVRDVMAGIGVPNLEGVLTEFAGLIPGLQANRFDLVGAGLYIRKSRCEQATPSNPVVLGVGGLAVKKGNPKNLHSYDDVAKNADAKGGTVSGSVDVEYFKTAGVPVDRVVLFPDVPTLIAGLQAGRIDAASMTVISLELQIKQLGAQDVELAKPFAGPLDKNGKPVLDYAAVYFRKEDTDLIDAFNTQLGQILESGKLLQLISPYGLSESVVPPKDAVATQLCLTQQ
jgi:polar amino acid transport system substrate-binding protein